MSSGGKGGGSSQQVQIPAWLENAAKENLERARYASSIGYTPYYGPDVAALSAPQQQAMQATGAGMQAFGLAGPSYDPLAGMPQPQTFMGGIQGYSSAPLYNQALAQLEYERPAQYDAITGMFIDPKTGARGMEFTPFGSFAGEGASEAARSNADYNTSSDEYVNYTGGSVGSGNFLRDARDFGHGLLDVVTGDIFRDDYVPPDQRNLTTGLPLYEAVPLPTIGDIEALPNYRPAEDLIPSSRPTNPVTGLPIYEAPPLPTSSTVNTVTPSFPSAPVAAPTVSRPSPVNTGGAGMTDDQRRSGGFTGSNVVTDRNGNPVMSASGPVRTTPQEDSSSDSSSSGGGCFITTATTHALGYEDDNNPILTTFRAFRDQYMGGKQGEASTYYEVAPKIVKAIDGDKTEYKRIWDKWLEPAYNNLLSGDLDGAYDKYKTMTLELKKRWID